jgi:hypothetical protein
VAAVRAAAAAAADICGSSRSSGSGTATAGAQQAAALPTTFFRSTVLAAEVGEAVFDPVQAVVVVHSHGKLYVHLERSGPGARGGAEVGRTNPRLCNGIAVPGRTANA